MIGRSRSSCSAIWVSARSSRNCRRLRRKAERESGGVGEREKRRVGERERSNWRCSRPERLHPARHHLPLSHSPTLPAPISSSSRRPRSWRLPSSWLPRRRSLSTPRPPASTRSRPTLSGCRWRGAARTTSRPTSRWDTSTRPAYRGKPCERRSNRPSQMAKSLRFAHNASYDLSILDRHGVAVAGDLIDTMIAAWLIDPGSHGLGLKDQAWTAARGRDRRRSKN